MCSGMTSPFEKRGTAEKSFFDIVNVYPVQYRWFPDAAIAKSLIVLRPPQMSIKEISKITAAQNPQHSREA